MSIWQVRQTKEIRSNAFHTFWLFRNSKAQYGRIEMNKLHCTMRDVGIIASVSYTYPKKTDLIVRSVESIYLVVVKNSQQGLGPIDSFGKTSNGFQKTCDASMTEDCKVSQTQHPAPLSPRKVKKHCHCLLRGLWLEDDEMHCSEKFMDKTEGQHSCFLTWQLKHSCSMQKDIHGPSQGS